MKKYLHDTRYKNLIWPYVLKTNIYYKIDSYLLT